MIQNLIELIKSLPKEVLGSIITISLFFLGWFFKVIYERYSLNFKLKKEFEFEQIKSIKEGLAKNKTPLLNIAEEFNYRLWNFKNNGIKNWHSIEKEMWFEPKEYYLRSFVYRKLVFLHWILKTESSLMHFDSTNAKAKDKAYIKYIKTFKNIFCDLLLLKDLGYKNDDTHSHYYKNNLPLYTKYITNKEGEILDFNEFYEKAKNNHNDIEKVFLYIYDIDPVKKNENYNVIRCFHLLLMKFLNEYGNDYQKTSNKKIKELISKDYSDIQIVPGFKNFLERNKLKKEMKTILKLLEGKSAQQRLSQITGSITKKIIKLTNN